MLPTLILMTTACAIIFAMCYHVFGDEKIRGAIARYFLIDSLQSHIRRLNVEKGTKFRMVIKPQNIAGNMMYQLYGEYTEYGIKWLPENMRRIDGIETIYCLHNQLEGSKQIVTTALQNLSKAQKEANDLAKTTIEYIDVPEVEHVTPPLKTAKEDLAEMAKEVREKMQPRNKS